MLSRGADLLDWFRGTTSTRRLLNLIDRLPSHSAYQEALAQDDDLAEQHADDEPGEYRPKVSEWSPTEQLLAANFNRLGEVIAAVIAAAGAKPPRPQNWPLPETAADRVLRRRQKQEYDDLLDLVEASKRR